MSPQPKHIVAEEDRPTIEVGANASTGRAAPQPVEYIVFGEGVDADQRRPADLGVAWVELGRATVTERFEAKARDKAEAQVTDTLPADEQEGPFVTIRAEHWQPRRYVIEPQPPIRRPVAP